MTAFCFGGAAKDSQPNNDHWKKAYTDTRLAHRIEAETERFRCLPMIAKIANALYIGSALAENKYAKRTDLSV